MQRDLKGKKEKERKGMDDYDSDFPALSPKPAEQEEEDVLPAVMVAPRRQGTTRKARPMTGVSDKCVMCTFLPAFSLFQYFR